MKTRPRNGFVSFRMPHRRGNAIFPGWFMLVCLFDFCKLFDGNKPIKSLPSPRCRHEAIPQRWRRVSYACPPPCFRWSCFALADKPMGRAPSQLSKLRAWYPPSVALRPKVDSLNQFLSEKFQNSLSFQELDFFNHFLCALSRFLIKLFFQVLNM